MKETRMLATQNLICFSHLRWDFVYQRPQHLLSRFSDANKVYFMEEPVFVECEKASFLYSERMRNLTVMIPQLPHGLSESQIEQTLTSLLKQFFALENMSKWIFWYYTPIALKFSDNFNPGLIIYDCMDELSAFKFAPESLKEMEKKLMDKADVVFTGGQSLYEAKKDRHSNIWPAPSSIDKKHWATARNKKNEPDDQSKIKGVKIGFYGVIDERFDLDLIKNLAENRPEWNIILIGPVVKIDPNSLPRNENIHYLGSRDYASLPSYLAGWNVALIPFAINESTKFISPTKTPEYLAAGIPVVSTAIRDVVIPYGVKKIVHIADDHRGFIKAIETELASANKSEWLHLADSFLEDNSWDKTYEFMVKQMALTKSTQDSLSIAN